MSSSSSGLSHSTEEGKKQHLKKKYVGRATQCLLETSKGDDGSLAAGLSISYCLLCHELQQ
jgi:hypothetical protein